MRYLVIIICSISFLFAVNSYASDKHPDMIIISAEASLTPDDVTEITLRYSKMNNIMVLKVQFSEEGKSKFNNLFKSNKGKKLALIDGKTVIMEAVYLQTETVSDQIDIFIEDEVSAFNLLKKLSK